MVGGFFDGHLVIGAGYNLYVQLLSTEFIVPKEFIPCVAQKLRLDMTSR